MYKGNNTPTNSHARITKNPVVIGARGVAESGVSDGRLAFFEAVDRTEAVADGGGAASATPGA